MFDTATMVDMTFGYISRGDAIFLSRHTDYTRQAHDVCVVKPQTRAEGRATYRQGDVVPRQGSSPKIATGRAMM